MASKTILSLILLISSQALAEEQVGDYSASDYFYPGLISSHQIQNVTSKIYSRPVEDIPEDERWSCVATEYSYNRDGHLVQVWLLRVASPWVYYYTDGRVSDAGFGGDEPMRMSESEDPQEFQDYLREVNSWILTRQQEFSTIHKRYFHDTCYNLDGLYRVEHHPSATGLPEFAVAYLLEKGDSALRTPGTLYIYYDYEYLPEHPGGARSEIEGAVE